VVASLQPRLAEISISQTGKPQMANYDVIVIGAGMAGASIAYELSADRRVLLLEREEHPGYHATGRSAAVYIPTYDFQLTPLFLLTRASREFLEAPSPDFSEFGFLKPRGLIMVCQQEQVVALKATYQALASVWPGVELVDGSFMRKLVPVLSDAYAACGIFERDVFDIDVHALHEGYLRGFKRRGGETICKAAVQSIARSAANWSVTTEEGSSEAPVVVNAAGAWADEVAALAGVAPVGLQPLRRTAILVDPPAGVCIDEWPGIADFGGQFYFKPDAGLILASPADETPSSPCDAQPEELDVAYAAHFAQEALGLQVRRVKHSWAGLRSFVEDRCPVVGFAPDSDGFFWLAGQGGHGIQIAPATARLAASLVRGETVPADLRELGFDAASVSPARVSQTKEV